MKQWQDERCWDELLKELNHLKMQNQKLMKQCKDSLKKSDKASKLFKQTLTVKLQYEKFILELNKRPEIEHEMNKIFTRWSKATKLNIQSPIKKGKNRVNESLTKLVQKEEQICQLMP